MPTTRTVTVEPMTTIHANGEVVECASRRYYNQTVNKEPLCAGATTTVISTIMAIATRYDASISSHAAEVSASKAAWSAAAAVPSARCKKIGDSGLLGESSQFQIYGINDWAGEGGKDLKRELNGCGIATFGWHDNTMDKFLGGGDRQRETQYLDVILTFFKGGCVERAVKSAGGPEIECEGQYLDIPRGPGSGLKPDEEPEPEPNATRDYRNLDKRSSRSADAPRAMSRGAPRP